ncbi:MAG: vitamin K epoxide reductase family protein [Gemmatimonadaceae bacterium]|jgi:uncharacterized membrane protein|nr:vitamin K epoxide reductase family protein [Gemmatimonadaceae bacterium]
MSLRRWIALLSLVSGLVAVYLALWKAGFTGSLACGASGSGGCEYVQGSRYGWFLGVDVAIWGSLLYLAIVTVATIGTLPAHEDRRWPTVVLMALVYWGVAFTAYLKYAEFVILRGFCPWCAVNAVVITLDAVLVTLDHRRLQQAAPVPLPA